MAQALEKDLFTLTWCIENFSMCPQKKGESISSSDFVVDALEKTTWYLKLYPKGIKTSDGEHVSVYLRRTNKKEEPDEVIVDFNFTLITSVTKSVKGGTKDPPNTVVKGIGFGYENFVSIKILSYAKNAYTPNDVFTVICCIRSGTNFSENPPDPVDVPVFLRTNTSYSMEEICTLISDVNASKKNCLEHCVLSTRIPVERRQITWVIKDFKTQLQSAKKKSANPVSVMSNLREKSELFLSCYVNSDCDSDGSVRINIERKDKNFNQMLMRCKVSVLKKNDDVHESREAEHLFGDDYEIWSFPPVVKLSTIENLKSEILDGDALKLRCEFLISYKGEELSIGGSSLQTSQSIDTEDLKHDLLNLWISKELTDVTLISEEEEIPVHKSVICSRSPVFKAMFTNETEEKRTGVVRIKDIDADTLANMNKFMYEDQLPELHLEDTIKLYSAADKYQFLKLKKQCAAVFKDSLSVTNVCNILVQADIYQDLELMASARNFLRVHSKEVLQSDEWKELMKENNQLATKLMYELLMQ